MIGALSYGPEEAAKVEWAVASSVTSKTGSIGFFFLLIAIFSAVTGGINGFMISSSKLLGALSNEKLSPAFLGKKNDKNLYPNAILFIAGISLIGPWIGREVIILIVDMASVLAALAYTYVGIIGIRKGKNLFDRLDVDKELEIIIQKNSELIELRKKKNSGADEVKETVEENISGNSDLSSLLGQEEIWELLLFSGYLTIDEKIGEDYEDVYSLRLPNREVREFFRKKFIDVNFGESMFRKAMEGLKNLKFNIFQKYLQNILLKSTSFMDTKNEDFYHGLVLGMMFYLDNHYYVKSNEESGLGRYDVVIEPKNKNSRGFILEFKVVKNEDNLEKVSEEAIEQIMEKKYDVGLKDRGVKDVTFVGVAFCGKVVKVSYR